MEELSGDVLDKKLVMIGLLGNVGMTDEQFHARLRAASGSLKDFETLNHIFVKSNQDRSQSQTVEFTLETKKCLKILKNAKVDIFAPLFLTSKGWFDGVRTEKDCLCLNLVEEVLRVLKISNKKPIILGNEADITIFKEYVEEEEYEIVRVANEENLEEICGELNKGETVMPISREFIQNLENYSLDIVDPWDSLAHSISVLYSLMTLKKTSDVMQSTIHRFKIFKETETAPYIELIN
jgi:hypothetical protein